MNREDNIGHRPFTAQESISTIMRLSIRVNSWAAPPRSSHCQAGTKGCDTAQQSLPSNFRLLCLLLLLFEGFLQPGLRLKALKKTDNKAEQASLPVSSCSDTWMFEILKEIRSRAADQQPHIYAHPLTNRLTDWLTDCLYEQRAGVKLPFSQRQEQQDPRPLPSPTSWLAAWLQGWMDGWMDNYECCLLPAQGFFLLAWAAIKIL